MAGVKGRFGRKPTPTVKLKLRGSYRRDRHGQQDFEPKPAARLPDRPQWLTGEARKEWERLGPLLAASPEGPGKAERRRQGLWRLSANMSTQQGFCEKV